MARLLGLGVPLGSLGFETLVIASIKEDRYSHRLKTNVTPVQAAPSPLTPSAHHPNCEHNIISTALRNVHSYCTPGLLANGTGYHYHHTL